MNSSKVSLGKIIKVKIKKKKIKANLKICIFTWIINEGHSKTKDSRRGRKTRTTRMMSRIDKETLVQ
jgi:hypothetical protein